MAGHTISLYLAERGNDVVGFSRRPVSFLEKQINGDAHNQDLLRRILLEGEFDICVNAIGILNNDAEENMGDALYLNAELPHLLADISKDSCTRVFQMSTDCVFAGNTGPYTETSEPDGASAYDRTKAAGELKDGKNLTFRNSIVGPDMNRNGIGLLNWFMAQTGSVGGYTHAIWTGLTTLELAKAMECAAGEPVTGLVNMVPRDNISKYELLKLFNHELRNDSLSIFKDDSVRLDKTLIRTNYESSYRPSGYSQQVAEMADWIRLHRDLYPHYLLG